MSIFDRLRRNPARKREASVKSGLIGLEIANHSLHLCQLRPEVDNRYTIIAKSSQQFAMSRQQLLESPKVLKKLIAQSFRKKNFKGRRVTAIMPPDQVKIILLTYHANVKDIDAEVISMLQQRIPGNIEDYVIDYLPVRNQPTDEEHIVMASVALRSHVDQFLDSLTYAGLQVHSLDIGPSALRRLISVLYHEDKSSNVLLINTGDESSYLTIVSGRRLLFDQPVKFGCNLLLQEISRTLELPLDKAAKLVFKHGFSFSPDSSNSKALISPDEVSNSLLEIVKPAFLELVEEINRVLIFTASETRGIPLSRVYLLGCLARLPGAHELVASLLDISVEQKAHEFYDIFQDDNDNTVAWSDQLPELAVATGLALRGLLPDA